MARLPFIVTHQGDSVRCTAEMTAAGEVHSLMVLQADMTGPQAILAENVRRWFALFNRMIDDGAPWDMFATFRTGKGLTGAIIDPLASAVEAVRDGAGSRP